MRKGQNFFQLPVTCRRGTKAEGGQPGVGKAVKSRAGGSDRPVDRPSAGRPPSLVSYCLNRRSSDQRFIPILSPLANGRGVSLLTAFFPLSPKLGDGRTQK